MSGAFGGGSAFNRASPSSDARCCQLIVTDYIEPVTLRPRRVLDVGGTQAGFAAHATLPAATELVIANPESGVGAHVAYVSDMPASDTGFDFAMLFGVMMYLDAQTLAGLIGQIRARLRGKATLLVAEPDYAHGFGVAEMYAQKLRAAIGGKTFTFHTPKEVRDMLFAAGFVGLRERTDLRPTYLGSSIPRIPPYLVIAASL